MNFVTHSYRHGEIILQKERYVDLWQEVKELIDHISDQDLIDYHNANPKAMSLSIAINQLLKERFEGKNWNAESVIFQESEYQGNRWRLDFAKSAISIEVAFNHGEAIAWNLIKPVLASELNHVQKAIQTEIGILITCTAELKRKGCFDGAVGEYEKFIRYLRPFSTVLTTPMVIIGLEPPETFKLIKQKVEGKNRGMVMMY